MIADPLLPPLAGEIEEAEVVRVLIGLNWVLVAATSGCGLAHAPDRGSSGCRPVDAAGGLRRLGLKRLAAFVASDNPIEVAIGIAAVNAASVRMPATAAADDNALDRFTDIAGETVILGRFPGIAERLPGARIVERRPGPGEVAEADAAEVIAAARGLVITASALANGGVSRALAWASPGCRVALVGPGTPLRPSLFQAGVTILAGSVVTDPERAALVVAEGGGARQLAPAVRRVALTSG